MYTKTRKNTRIVYDETLTYIDFEPFCTQIHIVSVHIIYSFSYNNNILFISYSNTRVYVYILYQTAFQRTQVCVFVCTNQCFLV
jgi:hypothetical protein